MPEQNPHNTHTSVVFISSSIVVLSTMSLISIFNHNVSENSIKVVRFHSHVDRKCMGHAWINFQEKSMGSLFAKRVDSGPKRGKNWKKVSLTSLTSIGFCKCIELLLLGMTFMHMHIIIPSNTPHQNKKLRIAQIDENVNGSENSFAGVILRGSRWRNVLRWMQKVAAESKLGRSCFGTFFQGLTLTLNSRDENEYVCTWYSPKHRYGPASSNKNLLVSQGFSNQFIH